MSNMIDRCCTGLLLSLAMSSACTKHNPLQCGLETACEDPAAPFCDIDGIVGGISGACIAGSCSPGEALACSDASASVCNSLGSSYDPVECALGCADDVRCKELVPSNDLAAQLAAAATAPDIELLDGDTLSLATGAVESMGQVRLRLTGVTIPASLMGLPITAFPVHSLRVSGSVRIQNGGSSNTSVAFLSAGLIEIRGTITLAAATPSEPPPGAFVGDEACDGSVGVLQPQFGNYTTGSGGGAYSTAGGDGGTFDPADAMPGRGGVAFVNPSLQPLRGGCSGGGNSAFGGGAIQLTSSVSIELSPNARLMANGQGGLQGTAPAGGGGAGGGILLEAPSILIASTAILSANGSGGQAGDNSPASVTSDGSQSFGGRCNSPFDCSNGGGGGSKAGGAENALALSSVSGAAGGGGGAAGYIRINSADGTFVVPAGAILTPSPSAGVVGSR